ncbi:MAG: orotate phosphoribosyltransferase [Oscillospiraceae bacterium]|jgi:orotate phosphoribosyltransferase|nr:orotate phosphoribosyltransferase [Oscillospiraceae bacterium]
MESRAYELSSSVNKKLKISVIPGHFATNHSHITHYIDLTKLKTSHVHARNTAVELASRYVATDIDSIICMDGMEVIAAFLAEELASAGSGVNREKSIRIITPEYNQNNQMIFRHNVEKAVWNKRVLILLASATTGKTINRSLECIKYYNGEVVAVAAIFSAAQSVQDIDIVSLFSEEDIVGYNTYSFTDCPYCAEKTKIDAIVNAYGYLKI